MSVGNLSAQSRGRVIRLVHNDPSVDQAIEAGFDRVIFERSTDLGSTYEEIGAVSERLVLEPGKVDYVRFDRYGDADYYYRVKYIDTKTGICSDPADAVQGQGLLALSVLSIEALKQRYLFGLDLTDDAGNPLPDSVYQHYILSAVSIIEHELDLYLLPTTIENERHDFYRLDFQGFSMIKLDHSPVISVEEWRADFPSSDDEIVYPDDWIIVDEDAGHIQLRPTAGTLSEIFIGRGGIFLGSVYGGQDYFPGLFRIDYTSGFPEGQIPAGILDMIGKIASMGPFNIFGDLIAGAGIANVSLSIDGLSQTIGTTSSATNAGYGARLGQYMKEVKEKIPMFRRFYRGVPMVVA